MLYPNTVIESRDGPAALPFGVGVHGRADDFSEQRKRLYAERAIDDVLADSFPASDPPSWNPGISRPEPVVAIHHPAAPSDRIDAGSEPAREGVIDIDMSSRVGDRTFIDALISLAGGAGIALLVPFVILLIGVPVALTIRGVLEVIGWLAGVDVR
jgi:hypothetical protein